MVTDHKPLVSLFAGTARLAPPRIERWAVLLQPYRFYVVYWPVVNNPVDYLSRHPLRPRSQGEEEEEDGQTESFVSMIVNLACPTALMVTEITDASIRDAVIGRANRSWKRFLDKKHDFDSEERKAMQWIWKVRLELSVSPEGLLLQGQRLVIPRSLHLRVVELAYQGHQGTAKTKACLREKVWFPRMDAMVDDLIQRGDPCAITARDPVPASVMTEPPSTRPWPRVSLDFGSFPDGRLTAVMIDLCVRFPVVELVTSTAFEHVHPVLEKVFALLGLPEEIRTDNVLHFTARSFRTTFAR